MARKAEPPPPAGTDSAPEGAGTEPSGDSLPPAPLSPADLDPSGAPGSGSIVPSDPFRRYLAEIRRYPRLTREEEQELATRYREKGDTEAARILATSNLRLVVHIAMDYRRSYLNLLDLIQDGNLGLLHAIKKYDPYRGVPFSAYAGYWIRAYVIKHLLDHWSLVRVGTTNVRRKLFYNLKREKERLEREGIQAGPKLLAEHMGADERDVVEVSQALQSRDLSMDQPVRGSGEGKDRFVWETMSTGEADPSEQVAREQLQDLLKEKIAAFATGLSERDRYILEARMVAEEPVTLQAIGDKFGTTREAVRQAEARLVKKLKEFLRTEIKGIEDFDVQAD